MLREKGVVFLGQTTTPEFGWKAVTDSALTGVTRNAWDASKTSGGSSGGAAVAAATGAGVFHLGTDGGGSIRVPSAFNGIVGLKPTFGRVPAYPASAFGTVAHIGPMARRVSDAAAMLGAMAGRSDKDWAQGPGLLPPLGPVEGALVNARVGYWREPPCGKLDPEVGAASMTQPSVSRPLARASSRSSCRAAIISRSSTRSGSPAPPRGSKRSRRKNGT